MTISRVSLIAAVALGAAAALASCSETSRAAMDARSDDRPTTVTCTGYNGEIFNGRSTGRIEFDETGRLTFVDAATGGLVITEGECIVRYDPARAAG